MSHDNSLAQTRADHVAAQIRLVDAEQAARREWTQRAATDPLHPLHAYASDPHWHVQCGTGERIDKVATIYHALATAVEALDDVARVEYDRSAAAADNNDLEYAFQRANQGDQWMHMTNRASGLFSDAQNPPWMRSGEHNGSDEQANVDAMRVNAQELVDRINAEGPPGMRIWQCIDTGCDPHSG